MTVSLAEQAQAFADRLTATIRAIVGHDCPAFAATVLEEASAFRVAQVPASGVILSNEDGAPILRMDVDYKCVYDEHDQYMAIEESQIRVFVEPSGRAPLFRYEFIRTTQAGVPSAHIQFHGEHRELEEAMKACGVSTGRAKARKTGRKPVRRRARRPERESRSCELTERRPPFAAAPYFPRTNRRVTPSGVIPPSGCSG